MIPFNKPFLTGKETVYIEQAVQSGKISGNGYYTQLCQKFFENKYGFKKCLLTTSCTDALEMASILMEIQPGDEVIVPSYTFVSTVNAFVLRGAKIIFADSLAHHPNLDVSLIEDLITSKTKAIVLVHYAGIACEMDQVMQIVAKHNLFLVEDSAQSIDSFYKGKPLGSFGHFSTFSFHETKNIISGEGGMLVINDNRFIKRAEIIWEKGTNRAAYFRGEVDKYSWVDIGSSFLPSEIISAFLYAQLEMIDRIQDKRIALWNRYFDLLRPLQGIGVHLPFIPDYSTNNGHIFYLFCRNEEERDQLIRYLKDNEILAVFHYLSLHKSAHYKKLNTHPPDLPSADHFSARLVRLPLFYELSMEDQDHVVTHVLKFYNT